MLCPDCQKTNPPGAVFCSFCGKRLTRKKTAFLNKFFFLILFIVILFLFYKQIANFLSKTTNQSKTISLSSKNKKEITADKINPVNNQQCDLKQSVKTAENCSVLIMAYGKNFQSQGSGFLYQEKNLILTNRHVIADASKIIVYDKNKNQYQASLWNYSQDLDLAVLKTKNNLPISACSINLSDVEKGEDVIALGYPATSRVDKIDYADISYSKGFLSRFAQYQNNYLIEFQATINPGNSGGPLVNSCGIIGIVTARSVVPEVVNIGFAISSISINKQLPLLLAKKTTQATAPDFNPVTPSYWQNPPYSYYEQYNIDEETIEKAKKLKQTINNLRQVWKTQDTSAFDKNLVESIKDILERIANVTENILPKVIEKKPLSNEEIRLLNELDKMIDQLNSYHQQLDLNFDGENYYYYACDHQVCAKKYGLGKNQCFSQYDCQPKYHYQCVNLSCQLVEGEGEDSCYSSDDCFHYVCQEGRCQMVEGKGNNECYSDYSCYHYECQDKKCVKINSPGSNQCISDWGC